MGQELRLPALLVEALGKLLQLLPLLRLLDLFIYSATLQDEVCLLQCCALLL